LPRNQELERTPPTPRALRSVRGSRLELARLYIQAKAGEIDPALASKLTYILSVLIRSSTDFALEERVAQLETQITAAKPNGHARSVVRP
jgi:hypothetical protein